MKQHAKASVVFGLGLAASAGCVRFGPDDPGGYLGVKVEDATVDQSAGVLVTAVDPDGAFEAAGILARDILVSLDGRSITDSRDLRQRLADAPLGEAMVLTIRRAGAATAQAVSVTLAADDESMPTFFGVQVREDAGGVAVTQIDDTPETDGLDLALEDVITAVNGSEIRSLDDFRSELGAISEGDTVRLRYRRDGSDTARQSQFTAGMAADHHLALEGATIADLPSELADELGMGGSVRGARVDALLSDSPAVDAGLVPGDVIVELTPPDAPPQPITGAAQLVRIVRANRGSLVELLLIRPGAGEWFASVQLRSFPRFTDALPDLGMSLIEESNPPTAHLRVQAVTSGGPAAAAGIDLDDALTYVGTVPVNTARDFWREVQRRTTAQQHRIVLQIERAGLARIVTVTLSPPSSEPPVAPSEAAATIDEDSSAGSAR